MKGGVYIVKYSNDSIKIGKSKNVYKRLQSYKGYQVYGQAVEKLLIIYCEEQYINDLEKWSHCYAETKNLIRINKCEVFQTDNIQEFILLIKRDIKQIFSDKVRIQDVFDKQEYTFQKQQQSNLQGNKEKSQQKQLEDIQNKINAVKQQNTLLSNIDDDKHENNQNQNMISESNESNELNELNELNDCKEPPIFQYMNQFKYGYNQEIKPKCYFYQQLQTKLSQHSIEQSQLLLKKSQPSHEQSEQQIFDVVSQFDSLSIQNIFI